MPVLKKTTIIQKVILAAIIAATVVIALWFFLKPDFWQGLKATTPTLTPEQSCIDSGGTWKDLPDSCGDSCALFADPSPACLLAFTPGCDCGTNQCWNGNTKTCETNPAKKQPLPPRGGPFKAVKDTPFDLTIYSAAAPPIVAIDLPVRNISGSTDQIIELKTAIDFDLIKAKINPDIGGIANLYFFNSDTSITIADNGAIAPVIDKTAITNAKDLYIGPGFKANFKTDTPGKYDFKVMATYKTGKTYSGKFTVAVSLAPMPEVWLPVKDLSEKTGRPVDLINAIDFNLLKAKIVSDLNDIANIYFSSYDTSILIADNGTTAPVIDKTANNVLGPFYIGPGFKANFKTDKPGEYKVKATATLKTGKIYSGNFLVAISLDTTPPPPLSDQLPTGVQFSCAKIASQTRRTLCTLQVPNDVVAGKLEFEIKKNPMRDITDVQKTAAVAAYSNRVFKNLESSIVSSGIEIVAWKIKVDFADSSPQDTTPRPIDMIQFNTGIADEMKTDTTATIILKSGAELYTKSSLLLSRAAFKSGADLSLSAPLSFEVQPVTSTFQYLGSAPPPPAGQPSQPPLKSAAPSVYCFDDAVNSMTYEEWQVICDAKKRGIISGTAKDGKTYFSPNQPLNRAEAAKILTLGVLKNLKKLTDEEITHEEASLKADYPKKKTILYYDIMYEAGGKVPWFAQYVSIASKKGIVSGYPDGDFRPNEKLNNVEAYKVIVETAATASAKIKQYLDTTTKRTQKQDWYLKYTQVLTLLGIPYSQDYGDFISKKEFVMLVMGVLK